MSVDINSTSSTTRRIRIGSEEHKELFCRNILDTFDPYKPAVIPWPVLDDTELARLTALPFWSLAVQAEIRAAVYLQAFADQEEDPLIREAVTLNVFEERRHKEVLEHMIGFYGIETERESSVRPPEDPELGYLNTGYGECFDSFFSFGLFRLAQDSGFFPPKLVEVFDPIVQEEARHILFFVNWAVYRQVRLTPWRRPRFIVRRAGALAGRARSRLRMVRRGYDQDKSRRRKTGRSRTSADKRRFPAIQISPRAFLKLCLAENERRMARYDPRLVRPQFLPRLARAACFVLSPTV